MRSRGRVRTPLFIIFAIALVVISTAVFTHFYRSVFIPRGNEFTTQLIDIKPGMSVDLISNKLKKHNLIPFKLYFKLLVLLNGAQTRLQAGEYEISPNESVYQALQKIKKGEVKLYPITILEGLTVKQVLSRLNSYPFLEKTDALPTAFLEGYLYPDTYFYPKGTPVNRILKRSHFRMTALLDKLWEDRDKSIPIKTKEEALILASIVEKEAGEGEWKLVASVLLNR